MCVQDLLVDVVCCVMALMHGCAAALDARPVGDVADCEMGEGVGCCGGES